MAPAGWCHAATASTEVADPGVIWCPWDICEVDVRTEYDAGWGLWSTWRIIEAVGPASAAWVAASYKGGGYADWCLASFAELTALYRSTVVDGLAQDQYWSSSQREIDTQDQDILDALCINFADRASSQHTECDPEDLLEVGLTEHLDVALKEEALLIRPVRSF